MLELRHEQHTELVAKITSLTKLERLYLNETPVIDIKPVAGLTNLTALDLSETPVIDIKPLAGLTKLLSVDLAGTRVSQVDIEWLKTKLPGVYAGR